MPRRRAQPRLGFTLIELLVVCALMVILAAILFPVFAPIREKGRQTVCLSHLQQIATGMLLYCDDHDDTLPLALARPRNEPVLFEETWMGRLQPYLKSTAILVDPASNRASQVWKTTRDLRADYGYPPSRRAAGQQASLVSAAPYAEALWAGLGGFSGPRIGDYQEDVPSCLRAQVARPVETILIVDHYAFDWGMLAGNMYYPAPRHLREADLLLPNGQRVPQGRINAAFVDGHVRSLTHKQFWATLLVTSDQGRSTRSVFRYFWPEE
jgi:prepilin-type N-terminal cleavage/methylation domain-containing protein/prepilin-type processing-associated H-X9-DG protein